MTTITKGNWCRLLFQRIDKAIADGFFLEATFIISGIIDDRLKSTITILDSTYSTRETIGKKCKRIRRFNDLDLRREFRYSSRNRFDLINEVSKWIREYRNPLTHTLADPARQISQESKGYINKSWRYKIS